MTLKNCEPSPTIPPFSSALQDPTAQPSRLSVQPLPPQDSKKDVPIGVNLGQDLSHRDEFSKRTTWQAEGCSRLNFSLPVS